MYCNSSFYLVYTYIAKVCLGMEYIKHENLLDGVHRGAWFGQNDRIDELNGRIYSRNIADVPLSPNFDPRPIATKQSVFPVINSRSPVTEPIRQAIRFHQDIHFAPTNNTRVNADIYFSNIDVETSLRNQTTALQHGASQGVFIPSSKSDLYNSTKCVAGRNESQPFPHLFKVAPSKFHTDIPENLTGIGRNSFFNHTRNQLRDM